jgi:3-methyladenine DNA glycosylase AlkD
MQGYLKSDMSMYGIQRPGRVPIEKSMWEFLANETGGSLKQKGLPIELYQTCVETLWKLPRREEKYLAIDVALHYEDCITMECLPLYENMLREDTNWWDLIDPMAVNLVGKVTYRHPTDMKPILKRWIRDDNMWIRRTAILAQLKFKDRMDEELLFQFCRSRMHEKEFFIRKSIGWVLRECSKTAPDVVRAFLEEEKMNMSGLSYREGSKILVKRGQM